MTTADQVQLDPHEDADDQRTYRPLSGLAVIAVVLGMLSALAILTPAMWFLPLAALIVALVALRRIATADPPMVGRTAALAGLFFAVFWGVAGVTTHFTQQWITRSQARGVAEQWFQYMLYGHTPRAHQLTLNPEMRDLRVDELDTVYATTPTLEERLEAFLDKSGSVAVLRFDANAEVEYIGTENQSRVSDNDYVLLVYALKQPGGPGMSLRLVIEMRRKPGESGGWIVQEVLPYSEYERLQKGPAPRR